ncbi:MAG TPA: potassium-transporting ATPase subunit KdpC [Gaiellaceae bacterium]|jgi:K+-transporting ATPase ATPase C chain
MRDLRAAIVAAAVLTALLGLGLPALFTGFAQIAFKEQANGSLISVNGTTVGSRLVAQPFATQKYFHARPSATSPPYNGGGTTFANLGPTDPDLAKAVEQRARAILEVEKPYNPGLTIQGIPVDAVTTSGSGVDPDISPAYARLQAPRVAAVRHLSLATVRQLIREHTDGRWLGFFGEPGVNVLELNLALDEESR